VWLAAAKAWGGSQQAATGRARLLTCQRLGGTGGLQKTLDAVPNTCICQRLPSNSAACESSDRNRRATSHEGAPQPDSGCGCPPAPRYREQGDIVPERVRPSPRAAGYWLPPPLEPEQRRCWHALAAAVPVTVVGLRAQAAVALKQLDPKSSNAPVRQPARLPACPPRLTTPWRTCQRQPSLMLHHTVCRPQPPCMVDPWGLSPQVQAQVLEDLQNV